jgi:hypothetical protein
MKFEAFRGAAPSGSLGLCAIGVRRIGPIKTSEESGIVVNGQRQQRFI